MPPPLPEPYSLTAAEILPLSAAALAELIGRRAALDCECYTPAPGEPASAAAIRDKLNALILAGLAERGGSAVLGAVRATITGDGLGYAVRHRETGRRVVPRHWCYDGRAVGAGQWHAVSPAYESGARVRAIGGAA